MQNRRGIRVETLRPGVPLLILLATVLVMFGDVLVGSRKVVLSQQGQDGDELFMPSREFASP